MGNPFEPPAQPSAWQPRPGAGNANPGAFDERDAEIARLNAELAARPDSAPAGDERDAEIARLNAALDAANAPKAPAPQLHVGDHVRFTSDSGAQYGQVIELATAEVAGGEVVDAACVAWVTGGESGPIPTEQLEVR